MVAFKPSRRDNDEEQDSISLPTENDSLLGTTTTTTTTTTSATTAAASRRAAYNAPRLPLVHNKARLIVLCTLLFCALVIALTGRSGRTEQHGVHYEYHHDDDSSQNGHVHESGYEYHHDDDHVVDSSQKSEHWNEDSQDKWEDETEWYHRDEEDEAWHGWWWSSSSSMNGLRKN